MSDEAGVSRGGLDGLLKGGSINTATAIEDLTLRAANSTGGLCVCVSTCDALSVGWVPGTARGTHIGALSSRVEVLLSNAALKEDALSLLETVVFSTASVTKSRIGVNSIAVVGNAEAVSIH